MRPRAHARIDVFIALLNLLVILLPATALCDSPKDETYRTEVDRIIHSYIDQLETVFSSEAIADTLRAANEQHQGLSLSQIKQMDAEWVQKTTGQQWIDEMMINACADVLFAFQDEHIEFVEMFITDRYGLNVCQTNKTSDYYQADEKWWIDTYVNGKGKTYHGGIEYDDSAFSEVISIYIPIRDKKTGEVLGVSKSVIDIIFVKAELS